MDNKAIGKAGLRGWRTKVADATAPRLARRTRADEDQIRAAIGALFLVLSIVYVIAAVKEILSDDDA